MNDYVWTADGKNRNGQIVISHPCGAQERCRPEVLDDVLRSLNREDKIERLNELVSTQYIRITELEAEVKRLTPTPVHDVGQYYPKDMTATDVAVILNDARKLNDGGDCHVD